MMRMCSEAFLFIECGVKMVCQPSEVRPVGDRL